MGLNQRTLERLDALLEVRENVVATRHIVRKDEPFSGLFAVRAGCFKSYVIDREGREHVKGFFLPGELMGLEGVSTGHYVTNIVALSDASVCDLKYESLLDISVDEPCLQRQLLNLFARNVANSTRNGGDFTADEKVAAFLLEIGERYGERGGSATEFELLMSRRDIGSFLRLATETVSRVLTRFQKRGLIHVRRKHVRLLDTETLADVAAAALEAR